MPEHNPAAVVAVGTAVYAWPGTMDDPPILTRTRSEVFGLGDGTRVVMVEGLAGGIALSHVLPRPDARVAEVVAAVESVLAKNLGGVYYPVSETSRILGALAPFRSES